MSEISGVVTNGIDQLGAVGLNLWVLAVKMSNACLGWHKVTRRNTTSPGSHCRPSQVCHEVEGALAVIREGSVMRASSRLNKAKDASISAFQNVALARFVLAHAFALAESFFLVATLASCLTTLLPNNGLTFHLICISYRGSWCLPFSHGGYVSNKMSEDNYGEYRVGALQQPTMLIDKEFLAFLLQEQLQFLLHDLVPSCPRDVECNHRIVALQKATTSFWMDHRLVSAVSRPATTTLWFVALSVLNK